MTSSAGDGDEDGKSTASTQPVSTPSPYKFKSTDDQETASEDGGDEGGGTDVNSMVEDMDIACAAVVAWVDEKRETQYLVPPPQGPNRKPAAMAKLKIHVEAEARAALFTIELSLVIQSRHNKTQAYLFISPDAVRSIALVDTETASRTAVQQQLKSDPYCLSFVLHQPCTLVLPVDNDVETKAKNEASHHAMSSLFGLAARRHFVVSIASRSVGRAKLLSLCRATQDFSAWKKPVRHGVLATLYGGKGGRVVSVPQEQDGNDDKSPPSYDDIVTSTKRRRCGSSSPGSPTDKHQHRRQRRHSETKELAPVIKLDHATENLISRITDHIDAGYTRLKDHVDRRFDDIQQQLDEMRQRQDGTVKELHTATQKIEGLDDDVCVAQSRLDDLEEGVGVQIEDEMYTMRRSIIDYVQEELRPEIGESVKRDVLEELQDQAWVLRPS